MFDQPDNPNSQYQVTNHGNAIFGQTQTAEAGIEVNNGIAQHALAGHTPSQLI